MTRARWLGVSAIVLAAGAGAWLGSEGLIAAVRGSATPSATRTSAAPPRSAAPRPSAAPAARTQPKAAATATGETPMAERVAIVGVLNKRNGEARDLVMKPGQAYRVGRAIVRLRACEQTAPWEEEQLTGAFLQLDVEGTDRRWRRAFSGWVFKERPALNVVQSPLYDVWPKSCTMRFPTAGPDTVSASSGAAPAARASNARKSPSTDVPPTSVPPADVPSAEPSNTL